MKTELEKRAIRYCQNNQFVKNEFGNYIYKSTNGACSFNLIDILIDFYESQKLESIPSEEKKDVSQEAEMVKAFYKIAETVDFSKPEHEGLWDVIFPFLKTNAELSSNKQITGKEGI